MPVGFPHLFAGGVSVYVAVSGVGGDLVVGVVLTHDVDEGSGGVAGYPG